MAIPKMKLAPGQHYKIYLDHGLPSKAELGRRGLQEALKLGTHDPKKICDFIPIESTVQLHAWGSFKFKGLKAIKEFVMRHINDDDLEEKLGGKIHYDIRHQKLRAPSWAGCTAFRQPWKGTAESKVQGLFKGVMQLTKPGAKLRAKIKAEYGFAPTKVATESGVPKWMDAEYYISPGQARTTNRWPEVMILIEHRIPSVLHRRDFDFMDVTYFGRYMKGRYYYRLVSRKLKEEEKPKTYRGPETKEYVYIWKAKDQFDENTMWRIAKGKIKIMPKSLGEGG